MDTNAKKNVAISNNCFIGKEQTTIAILVAVAKTYGILDLTIAVTYGLTLTGATLVREVEQ